MWDIEGRFPCGSIPIYGIGHFDDLTFNPSTNSIWLTARGGLMQYDLTGHRTRSIPARQLRASGIEAVEGVKWLEGSTFLVSHRERAKVSVIDVSLTENDAPGFRVTESMAVREAGSTALGRIPGASGILIVYPSNLTDVYRVDEVEGEERFFNHDAPASSIDYESLHFASDQGKLFSLCRTCGRFPGSIAEVESSGEYTAYPLRDLVVNLTPKALEFLPSGSIMFLAGYNREALVSEVQFFCAADVRDNPNMFVGTLWQPVIMRGTGGPGDLGLGIDVVKSGEPEDADGVRGGDAGVSYLGGDGTPDWLKSWLSTGESGSGRTGPDEAASTAPGRFVYYTGYGYKWEV
jgi:hypothetical protein